MPDNLDRRQFLTGAAATGLGLSLAAAAAAQTQPSESSPEPQPCFKLYPIGKVEVRDKTFRIRIFKPYVDGLLGLEQWSHVNVFYWFDKNDTPQQRAVLRVRPQANESNPLTGVFACRAPVRPNLIALSVCRILAVDGDSVILESIDAFDGTPVLDLKPFIPPDNPSKGVRVPPWASAKKKALQTQP